MQVVIFWIEQKTRPNPIVQNVSYVGHHFCHIYFGVTTFVTFGPIGSNLKLPSETFTEFLNFSNLKTEPMISGVLTIPHTFDCI